jgi:phosphate transport system substrate-binding protein
MKNELVLLVVTMVGLTAPVARSQGDWDGRIGCSGAWALYPMAVKWGEEFTKLHPKVRFDISAGGAGKGMTDALTGAVDIGLVSRDLSAVEVEKGAFGIAVTKDAVVAVVSEKNPALAELRRKGVKKETLQGIWVKQDVKTWGKVVGSDLNAAVRVYTRSDACGAAETWAKYLGGAQEGLKGVGVYGDPGLGEAVRRDALGIGYNNVNYAYDSKTAKPVAGLAVVPLDVNRNGVIDKEEDFYATRSDLVAAIGDKRYPAPPARDLYFVTKGRPASPVLVAFIKWVLTDGQKFVVESGYIQLPVEQLKANVEKLVAPAR